MTSAYKTIHSRMSQWYQSHGRSHLPWRNTTDPYHIYLSEIMLQQTQVKTVLERYYTPFLNAFPTLQSLADAPLEQVLKQWEGLGYYSRARNLHKAAQLCAPSLPETREALLALPGIGENTAHAILAFAYHQPVPVMEANVKRILHRVFAHSTATIKQLWLDADKLLNRNSPFDHNQTMMDIGAMLCTPKSPNCPACPLNTICKGKSSPERYPAPKTAKTVPTRRKHILILQSPDNRYYLTSRTTRFLGGLYGFPELTPEESTYTIDNRNLSLSEARKIGSITQKYSHFTLNADLLLLPHLTNRHKHWYSLPEIISLPKSKADEKILKILQKIDSR